MNYTYRLPIFEAPGDAFAKMSDDQFNDYKQKNPGGADKADRVRKQAQARANKSNNTSNNTSIFLTRMPRWGQYGLI